MHRDSRVKWKERVASLRARSQSVVARAGESVINTGPTGLLGAARPQPSGKESLMNRGLQGTEEVRRVTSHYVFRGCQRTQ